MFDHIVLAIFHFLYRLGGFGLIVLGVFDSSFLFMPLGNDMLVVAFTVRHAHLLLYYAAMATAGSVLGCFIMDAASRKIGEEGIEKRVSKKRLDFVRRRLAKGVFWALFFAALMPPPFPFTVFIIVPAALQESRKKMFLALAVGRFVRFSCVGLLAVVFGSQIIAFSKEPAFKWIIIAFAALCIAGTALSLYRLVKKSRSSAGSSEPVNARRS